MAQIDPWWPLDFGTVYTAGAEAWAYAALWSCDPTTPTGSIPPTEGVYVQVTKGGLFQIHDLNLKVVGPPVEDLVSLRSALLTIAEDRGYVRTT